MATTWKAPTWRMPNDKNQSKFESYSLDFNTASQTLITTSDNVGISGSQSRTMSVWLKGGSTNNGKNWPMAVAFGNGSTNQAMWIGGGGSPSAYWYFGFWGSPSATSGDLASTVRMDADDNWHLLTSVYDESTQTAKGYIDGVEVVSGSRPSINTGSSTLNIGKHLTESTYWDGPIGQTAIFDYALSSDQISSLYNSGSPINPMTLKPAPIAYYPLGGNASTGGNATNTLSVPNVAVPDASVFNFDNNPTILFDNNFFTPSGTVGGTGNFMQVSSISWWMKSSRSGSYSVIFPFDANNAWMLRIDNLGNMWWFAGAGTNYVKFNNVTANSINLCDSQWHHCVFTIPDANDKNQCKFFIDNQEITSTTTAGASTGNGALYIMTKLQLAGGYLGDIEGTEISNVQVWLNTALGNSDINTIYNNGVPLMTGTQPQASNLKAWYKLDQSANWEADTVGNWQIPDAVSSYPQSFDFIPTDDRISINELQFTGEFSISMWINPRTITGGNTFIIGRWNGNFDNDIKLSLSNNTPVVTLRIGGSGVIFYGYTTSSQIPLNEWSHLSIIRNSSNDINCYLNGVQFSTTTGSSTNTLTLDSIGRVINTSYGWDGRLSNIAMWDTALTPSQLYNNGIPLTTAIASANLKAWYKLNDNEKFDGINWSVENQKYPANWESALYFDGTNAVDLPTIDFDMTNNLTLSCWINPAGFSTWDYLCTRGGAGGANSALNFRFSAAGRLYSSYLGSSLDTAVVFPTNQWSHLAITFNYSTGDVIFYKNGIQTGNTLTFANGYATAGLSNIGDVNGTGSSGMNALISNFAVWESLQDISELYNDGTPATSYTNTPTAWWKLNNLNTGLIDNGTGGNNATNVGTVQANTFVSTEAGTSSGMTEQNLVNNNVSALNGESSGMDTSNLVTSTLTRQVPYNSYSLNFDAASSDNIAFGTAFGNTLGDNYTGDVSFSFWYNADANSGIFSLGNGSSYGELHAQIVSGKLSWGINNDVWRRITSTSLGLNTWNHIVLIYKNGSESGSKIYVNGSEASTTTAGGAFPTSNLNFAGKLLNVGSFWVFNYDGKLSNFSAFNEALTSTEVMKLYNSGVPGDLSSFTPTPIAWWSLGSDSYFNGTSWICTDLIGTNNGTSSGMDVNSLIGDAPNSSANGTSTNMTIDANLTGNAPNSSNNSFSVNMSYDDRVSGSGNVPE